MNRRFKTVLYLVVAIISLLFSCLSPVPVEADGSAGETTPERVFLKQRREFQPIDYPATYADPYNWDLPDADERDAVALLDLESFDHLLAPSREQDARLYREAGRLLSALGDSEGFVSLMEETNIERDRFPSPMPATLGEMIRDYSNARAYHYPGHEGAEIILFDNGDVEIRFVDGSLYSENEERYFFNDPQGETLYARYSDGSAIRRGEGFELTLRSDGGFLYRRGGESLEYNLLPRPQYALVTKDFPLKRYWFVPESGGREGAALFLADKTRIDYYESEGELLFSKGEEAVLIQSDLTKIHTAFDPKLGTTGRVRSLYLPEGIRFTGLDSDSPRSELIPAWPEDYQEAVIGSFRFLVTQKDRKWLEKIEPDQLVKIPEQVLDLLGFVSERKASVILPPDLESYRKLYVRERGELIRWYPSGFQTRDFIVMWPPSVPRYRTDEGQRYFEEREFYEILTHEYTHLVTGRMAGLINPIPSWLNEGLALTVEGALNPEVSREWIGHFALSGREGRLLDWDEISQKPTGSFGVEAARVHYAQGAVMTGYLLKQFGVNPMIRFLRSFHNPGEVPEGLRPEWKESFRRAFGVSWEENLDRFEQATGYR